jgi:hypothetical protein
MKRALVALAVAAVLSIGTSAFAHMPGKWRGYGHGHGYGRAMGYSGAPVGFATAGDRQKFLDETASLRKEMHEKRFDLGEASRKSDAERAAGIRKEMDALRAKIHEIRGNYAGYTCPGPYGR